MLVRAFVGAEGPRNTKMFPEIAIIVLSTLSSLVECLQMTVSLSPTLDLQHSTSPQTNPILPQIQYPAHPGVFPHPALHHVPCQSSHPFMLRSRQLHRSHLTLQ